MNEQQKPCGTANYHGSYQFLLFKQLLLLTTPAVRVGRVLERDLFDQQLVLFEHLVLDFLFLEEFADFRPQRVDLHLKVLDLVLVLGVGRLNLQLLENSLLVVDLVLNVRFG